ncbi:MAG TPA: DUF2075 domain-containing protein [Acetobacteraceae bacterium]|nr:DUF2075 domain-containing protein [Acetobacteraceae bacterium]
MSDPPALAAWHGDVPRFLALDPAAPCGPEDARWRAVVPVLQAALPHLPAARAWRVVLDFRLLRLRRRIDAVLVTDRAVVAFQVRPDAQEFGAADRLAAEDAALDLADFHAWCRGVPVLPVLLVPNGARARAQFPLPLAGAAPVVEATRLTLPGLLRQVALGFPRLDRVAAEWSEGAYAPVPGLIEAACLLYARHDVASLLLARAGPAGLARTEAAVQDAVRRAQEAGERRVVFVTGEPGAGKTLCGLNLAFTPGLSAAFLTGNPTLVHVLRQALVRDAVLRGAERRGAQRRMAATIQALPAFRDHFLSVADAPPERLVVIDEAQRCWSGRHAVSKTRNRAVRLADSEPGHLLDIMARRPGWSAVVCLVGGGQEIHDGEGGLAAWGSALACRPQWRALAPEDALRDADPRQRLPEWDGLELSPDLHLRHPIRAVRSPLVASWVDAVLTDRPEAAAAIAREQGGVPFQLTRSLEAMRAALRQRGTRSAGLVASSGARRLRAEGLGAMLAHQDEDAVARWFLDRWPDIRSSDALEVAASEFGVQGLELDRVGLCWDADLVRGASGWVARRFRANTWTLAGPEARSNRLNAYRVLLTRARHGTLIWVPRGATRDGTREPALYDRIAEYLLACGAGRLDESVAPNEDGPCVAEDLLL